MKQTNKELKKLLLSELDNLSDEQLREYGYERIEDNNKRKRFKKGSIRQIKLNEIIDWMMWNVDSDGDNRKSVDRDIIERQFEVREHLLRIQETSY